MRRPLCLASHAPLPALRPGADCLAAARLGQARGRRDPGGRRRDQRMAVAVAAVGPREPARDLIADVVGPPQQHVDGAAQRDELLLVHGKGPSGLNEATYLIVERSGRRRSRPGGKRRRRATGAIERVAAELPAVRAVRRGRIHPVLTGGALKNG